MTNNEEKCVINPERDCNGLIRSKELEKDLAVIEKDLNDLRRQNNSSHERIFDRLQALETQQSIQIEKCKFSREKLTNTGNDVGVAQKEIKDLSAQIQRLSNKVENNERMAQDIDELQTDLKALHKELTSTGYRVDSLEHIASEVDAIKEKPAKKWEDMTGKILWVIVAAILGLALARIGLTP